MSLLSVKNGVSQCHWQQILKLVGAQRFTIESIVVVTKMAFCCSKLTVIACSNVHYTLIPGVIESASEKGENQTLFAQEFICYYISKNENYTLACGDPLRFIYTI